MQVDDRKMMSLRDWTLAQFQKNSQIRAEHFDELTQNLETLKGNCLDDIKIASEKQEQAMLHVRKETAMTVKKIEEFMLVDPLPEERINKLKSEIKAELDETI